MDQQFYFNEKDICTNPNQTSFKKNRCKYTIYTARCNDGWVMGYALMAELDYMSAPCECSRDLRFPSESEALKRAADIALHFFLQDHYSAGNSSSIAKIPREIFDHLNDIFKTR